MMLGKHEMEVVGGISQVIDHRGNEVMVVREIGCGQI